MAFRSLRARPTRTALTVSAIILGVAVILAISITNLSTLESIQTLFSEASGKAHLVVTGASAGSSGFPEDAIARVAGVPGVRAAVPSLQAGTLLADDISPLQMDVGFFGAATGGLVLYGIDPALDGEAREYRMVAGRFLHSGTDDHDVVLVEDYADDRSIEIGRDLKILTPYGVEILRVVGFMSKEGPGQINNGAFGVLPLQAAQSMFGRSGDLDQIDIVALPEDTRGARLESLKASLQDRLGDEYAVVYPASQGRRVTKMLDTYQMGLSFFSVIALFVGAFLIYNAFSMTVVERTRETGMLRAVGMTRRQVMAQVLTEAVLMGVVGSVLGVWMGILLSRGLIRLMELLLAQEVRNVQIPPSGLLISLAVGGLTTVLAAAIPAFQAGRTSPLEALRVRATSREGWIVDRGWQLGSVLAVVSGWLLYANPFPPAIMFRVGPVAVLALFVGATLLIPFSVGAWERWARPWVRRVYGNEGRLGSSNVQRARMRTALTAAALMVGTAMILAVQGMTSAFAHDIRSWIEVYVGGDLYVYSSVPMRTDLERRLEAVEGVEAVTPTRYFEVEFVRPSGGSELLTFTAVDPRSYSEVTSFVFSTGQGDPDALLSRLAEGDAVFVSSVMSERYGLEQGDSIRLLTKRGARDFEVAAVVVDFYDQGLVLEGSWKDMRRYFGLNDVSSFLLKVQPGYSLSQVQDRIDHLYGERRHLTTESNEELKATAFRITAQAFSLFDVLALIAIIVAALGVVNTLTMSVLERTQEIGMLRSLGMTRRQVAKMILAEAGMLGLLGGGFGLLFGLFLSRLFLVSVTAIQGYELTYIIPTQGILISVLLALVASQLAALWPARRAAGLRIIEAIQFE